MTQADDARPADYWWHAFEERWSAGLEGLPPDFSAEGVALVVTCPAVPTQLEGTVDGNPCYFRARHGSWRFTIAAPGDNPVRHGWPVQAEPPPPLLHRQGTGDPDPDEAWAIIGALVEWWRAGGA
jgi:hypothetical protein